jgi:pimeloyl-ACP methyl ester carboxylesterase
MASAVAIAGVLVTAVPVGAAEAEVPVLDWRPCPGEAGFECATAVVPMDYARPGGKTFSLAVIKSPAGDPSSRIGTLFWNPGGPSDAGTEYLPASIGGFPEQVRRRFDIVSWDPRGMGGRTTPVVQCFDNADDEGDFLEAAFGSLPAIPVSDQELARYIGAHTRFNRHCVRNNGDLLAHVSTADNARDLDLLRRAVGDDALTYYGTSYGTFLGATYLNMFPERVRAAVLDGAAAPGAWEANDGNGARLSTFLRIGSDLGGADTVRAFLDECGKVDTGSCAFSAGSPPKTRRKWATLLARLEACPAATDNIQGLDSPIDDRALISYVTGKVYLMRPLPGFERFPGWRAVARTVQAVWEAADSQSGGGGASGCRTAPSPSPQVTAATPDKPPVRSTYGTSVGRQLSVICGESPNPTVPAAYAAQARFSYKRAGLNLWPFAAVCSDWSVKASDPYPGPWDKRTPPVLVIGNTFDPATPYSSSRRMAKALWDGRLLTVDGFGHTQLLNPSRCAQDYVADYLIDGSLPPAGARCAQDFAPFSQ